MGLRKNGEDYVLVQKAWIGVGTLSVYVHRTAEGIVVDVFRKGEEDGDPITSTYAYFGE